MSPLSRNQIHIALCPDRLITAHCTGLVRPRVVAKKIYRHGGAEQGWQAAIPVLQTVLDDYEASKADVRLVISNHFMRYQLLPWNDVMLTDAEKRVLLEVRFAEAYGESSEAWSLRVNEGAYGCPSLASAMDSDLLNQLTEACGKSALRLRSVQPYLMTAFNSCRRELGKGSAWFVITEYGVCCIGLLKDGEWQCIRLRRTEGDWFEEAMLLLEREMLRAENQDKGNKVLFFAPEHPELEPVDRDGLELRPLTPRLPAMLAPEEMRSYAMAVAGI